MYKFICYNFHICLQDCVGPGPDFDCEAAGGDGFYEYAKNCIKYIQCYGGVPQIHTCNPGKIHFKITMYYIS